MATPSSSATSPSPILAFSPPVNAPSGDTEVGEGGDRRRAVEKFRARAEISNVTRSLRARLAYASYKATHNLAHVPLRDLEAQSQTQAHILSRTMAAKRKAAITALNSYSANLQNPGANNYYNNPATQGGSPTTGFGAGGKRNMPPPGPMRYYYPRVEGSSTGGISSTEPPALHRPQSLFTSILAPPPTQPARTILNVADPPIPPPSRPPASPQTARVRTTGKPASSSRGHGTQQQKTSAARRGDPQKARAAGAAKRVDKGKARARATTSSRDVDMDITDDVDADGDVDMKAAATLTHLLLNHRPSIGASSPRSSLDGGEGGGGDSVGYARESSARNAGTPQPPPPSQPGAGGSRSTPGPGPEFRQSGSTTPPPTQPSSQPSSQASASQQQGTPRPAPTDNEAADLMLFLATSPSPVRRGAADRDAAAFRALSSRPKGSVGRVLFPSAGELGGGAAAASGSGSGMGGLARGGAESFTSSVSSIGGMSRGATPTPPSGSAPVAPAPVQAQAQGQTGQLLPPPAMHGVAPSPIARPVTPTPKAVYGQPIPPPQPAVPAQVQAPPIPQPVPPSSSSSPAPPSAPAPAVIQQPQPQPPQPTPPQPENFNFSDFLHASPAGSPAPAPAQVPMPMPPAQPAPKIGGGGGGNGGGGLRADVGRKLFEEHLQQQQAGKGGAAATLGAGIDLMQQS